MNHEDYERRMQNWRRWRLSAPAASTGASPAVYEALASGIYSRFEPRQRESSIPLLVGEAEDTDKAVRALDKPLQAAVVALYLERGGMDSKAKRCGCRRDAFKARLDVARGLILSHLEDQRRTRLEAEERLGSRVDRPLLRATL